ncbi:MAG: hypothetical protein M1600_07680 [Firmicutes bacterium]|nr:hypothetical protein [Bacillota bacterium]
MAQSPSREKSQLKPKSETAWWLAPNLTLVVFSLFVLYSAWEVLTHNVGRYQNYLSPYFSPDVGLWLGVPFLPAVLVAWIPLGFRASCYYYRREYYRGFFRDPAACGIHDRSKRYQGETRAPLSWNNLHRFFLYLALVVVVFLWKDAVDGFWYQGHLEVGLGSLILLLDAILLSFYTFSCHAFRHLVGGNIDCFSCQSGGRSRYRWWRTISTLNQRHGLFAWTSMFMVWGTDLYIRLLLSGVIHDVKFF